MHFDTEPHQRREIVVTAVFALLFGGGIFCFALLIAGEIVIPLLLAVTAMAVVGGLHYVLWGRAMSQERARRRFDAELEDYSFRRDNEFDALPPAQQWRERYHRPVD